MRGKVIKIFIGIAAAFGLLVFLYNTNLLDGLVNATGRVILPVSGAIGGAKNSAVKWFSGVFNPGKIIEDNNRLSYELSRAVVDKARSGVLETENALLKKELGFKEKSVRKTVLARIIGKNNLDDTETVIINKGSSDGLGVGQAVVYADGILIGKIIKISDDFSFVRLVNDSDIMVAATITNANRTTGIIRGERGLSLKMELIPQNEVVSAGDIIVTSGLETGIPRGLVVGTVDSVIKESRSPFQTAIVRSPVNFNNLDYVLVITDK